MQEDEPVSVPDPHLNLPPSDGGRGKASGYGLPPSDGGRGKGLRLAGAFEDGDLGIRG